VGDPEKMWAAGLLVPSHIFDLGFTKAYRTKFAMSFEACLEEKSSNREQISTLEGRACISCLSDIRALRYYRTRRPRELSA
jgi:hypothetical protein